MNDDLQNNYRQLIADRGITHDQLADELAPTSPHAAEWLRGEAAKARAAAEPAAVREPKAPSKRTAAAPAKGSDW